MPTDLGQFMEVINDLGRRMSPLAQLAEQAGGMFGLRIPGLSRQAAPSAPAPAATAVSSHAAGPVGGRRPGGGPGGLGRHDRRGPGPKRAARKAPAKKAATKKRAAAKRSA